MTPYWLTHDEIDALAPWSGYGGLMQCKNGQWYHCDETWTAVCGPYGSRELAKAALHVHAEYLDGRSG